LNSETTLLIDLETTMCAAHSKDEINRKFFHLKSLRRQLQGSISLALRLHGQSGSTWQVMGSMIVSDLRVLKAVVHLR